MLPFILESDRVLALLITAYKVRARNDADSGGLSLGIFVLTGLG